MTSRASDKMEEITIDEMLRIQEETAKDVIKAKLNPLIPDDYKRRLLRASALLTELVYREVSRNAKSQ